MFFAISALTLGLAAGLKPGPLGIFVIHQTMSRGTLHGFLASLAPIITDGPIIGLALLLSFQVDELDNFIGLLSLLGSLYLAFIAYKTFNTSSSIHPLSRQGSSSSLGTAIKINFLNPAPYIFWLTIGSSYLLMGTTIEAVIFIFCALLSLCLTKFTVAFLFKQLGSRFNHKIYALILKSLSVPLIIFSIQLLITGINSILS